MILHLHSDIEKLKKLILALSACVEENVRKAVTSFHDRDPDLAREVIESDEDVDNQEIEVEEFALKILALNQPVAIDLRFIVAVIKMNNDLERIADLAVNLAEQTVYLSKQEWPEIPAELGSMETKSRSMLSRSLDAVINLDSDMARQILIDDDEVDLLLRQMYKIVRQRLIKDSEHLDKHMSLLFVSRYLERIADLATNIAEDVIYTIEGEIVRHKDWGDVDEEKS